MPRDARFWRNVALIAIAHLAVLLALARGGRDTRNSNLPSIVWMNSGAAETVASSPPPPVAEIETPPTKLEKHEEPAAPTLAKSEIQLPSPTPIASPTPKATAAPTAIPKPSQKPTAKPTPKPTPKKTIVAKATPKPSPKIEKVPEKKEKTDSEKKDALAKKDSAADKSSSAENGPGNGSGPASEFAWYRSMLHDRFHKEWEQPRTIVVTGAKMSTLVKIRIEKNGRVSKFTIVKPSGNVVVDESVAAIAQRVTQVDALPSGMIKGAYYEVQINFELNPEK
jgi:TonB family protein